MPPPYDTPGGGGDRPPFEVIIDGANNPPASTEMALTVDAPDDPNAPTLTTTTTGKRYIGTQTVVASQTGTLGSLARMDRSSGDVDHAYADLTGVTITGGGTVVTSVTAGQTYTVHINVPA